MQNDFNSLKLIPPLLKALKDSGYTNPTPIQKSAIPILLQGHDLLGVAQTGTGKTAAFSLPILQNLATKNSPRSTLSPKTLILTPTRELAIQIHQSLEQYGKYLNLKYAVIFGGVGQGKQVESLRAGVDILVATPGRLLDLQNQRLLRLDKVEIFVLDEADRMLDMGFYPDIRRILPLLPKRRHNLFFSATMPKEIQELASQILHNPQKVEVTPAATTAEKVSQMAYYVEKPDKLNLLLHLLKDNSLYKVLVFVSMKHLANKISDKLNQHKIPTAAIHSDKSQNARQRSLQEFRDDKLRVLIATDIMARGIDVDGITHVINYDIPHIPEEYVHRIGRTARAGNTGQSISFCTEEEKSFISAIEKITRQKIEVNTDQPYHSEKVMNAPIVSVGKAKAQLEKQRIDNKNAQRSGKPKHFSKNKSGHKKSQGEHRSQSSHSQGSNKKKFFSKKKK